MIIALLRDKPDLFSKGKGKQSPTLSNDSATEDDDDGVPDVVDEGAIGWAYVGSHNFTPSAWGTLSGSSFNPTLNVSMCLTYYPDLFSHSFNADHEL